MRPTEPRGAGAAGRGSPTLAWPGASALRIGLGCMRLSTGDDGDDARSLETIAAAAGAGVTVFETARAYARDETELGHNERLLARALRACGAAAGARIVTKGGMARTGGGWVPDGRAQVDPRRLRGAAWPPSAGLRSTSTCCMPPTRARPGRRPCARSAGSGTRGSWHAWGSRT